LIFDEVGHQKGACQKEQLDEEEEVFINFVLPFDVEEHGGDEDEAELEVELKQPQPVVAIGFEEITDHEEVLRS
jgi:hypothetical protein